MPSSVVASFTYKKETAVLKVVFVSGSVYEYLGVPEWVYHKMKTSGSKGIFLNTQIKGRFAYKKLK
jgi:hypothetical protein